MKTIFLFLFIINIVFAQDPYIAQFYDNKQGAVSISFDDGSYGQYEYAFESMKKYNFVGTFGIVGEWTDDTCGTYSEYGNIFYKRLSKKNLYSLWSRGNEIAWHGLKHIAYNDNASWNVLDKQLSSERIYAELLLSPIKINTILYPYSKTQGKIELAVESSGFLFGRTGNDTYNDVDNINYYLLNSFAIYNDNNPTIETYTDILEGAKGKWCILMYHHIIPDTSKAMNMYRAHNVDNNYAITPVSFDYQMLILSVKNYWIGTIYDIGRYLLQKERSDLYVEYEENGVYVTIECDLDPEIYNQTMTIVYNGENFNIKPNVKTLLKK